MSTEPTTPGHQPGRDWDRPLALVLLGLPAGIVAAATLAPLGATRIYTWPWAFYVQVAMLAPWLWCAWRVARGDTGLRAGWIIALPLLGALALAVATSAHRQAALEASLVLATPLVLLPFLAKPWTAATPAARLLALRGIGVILALVIVVSLTRWFAQAPDSDVVSWFLTGRNPHPLGHWNYTGGLALLALPVTALLALRERGPLRFAWAVSTILGLLAFVSAGSRGAVLGLIAGIALAGAALAARRRWSPRVLLGGLAVILLLGATAVATNPRLRQIVRDPASALQAGESEQQRLGFLLTGLNIARAHPWTGIGPGATPYHYPTYRVDLPGSLENSFQLHCGPLQWWVDTGALGLAALAFVGGWLTLRLWRARRSLSDEAVSALALLGGYGVFWLTDHQLDAPVFPLVLTLAAAVLIGSSDTPRAPAATPASARLVPLAAILTLLPIGASITLIPSWRARAEFSEAWHAKDRNDPNAFLKHLRAASHLAPAQPLYHNHLARALAGIAAHLPPETAAALRAEARAAWQASLAAAPAQDHPWINLGWLALHAGDASPALEYFGRAAAIQPRRTGLGFATALAHLAHNAPDAAARALAQEIRHDPAFITSPLWRDAPFAALRDAVIAALREPATTLSGDPDTRPPAPAKSGLADFARWWWHTGPDAPAPSAALLQALDDRAVALTAPALPSILAALREHWRTGAPLTDPRLAVPHSGIAATWTTHVASHRDASFSALLKTHPAVATRKVARSADGILFRQLDGDPLTDLTEFPAHPLDGYVASIFSQGTDR